MGKPLFLEIPGFGLSNRIRTLLAFHYIAQKRSAHLYVYWLVNRMCPDHFDNIFEPLENVTFIKSQTEFNQLRKKYAGATYFKGQAQFHSLVNRYLSQKISGASYPNGHSLTVYRHAYSKLKPLPHIQEAIDEIVTSQNLKSCDGLHLRRTDHVSFIKRMSGSFSNDAHFEKIIKSNPDRKFYLATDNVETQQKFLKQFPDQLIVYQNVPKVKQIRKTSMDHAVIDLYLLGNCRKVFGSFGSSFSEFAYRLHAVFHQSNGHLPGTNTEKPKHDKPKSDKSDNRSNKKSDKSRRH